MMVTMLREVIKKVIEEGHSMMDDRMESQKSNDDGDDNDEDNQVRGGTQHPDCSKADLAGH